MVGSALERYCDMTTYNLWKISEQPNNDAEAGFRERPRNQITDSNVDIRSFLSRRRRRNQWVMSSSESVSDVVVGISEWCRRRNQWVMSRWCQLNRRTSSSLPFPFILSPFSLRRFLLISISHFTHFGVFTQAIQHGREKLYFHLQNPMFIYDIWTLLSDGLRFRTLYNS